MRSLAEADLLFIIGTSLQVEPFASLTTSVPRSCPRVLINLEEVGDLGTRRDDVSLLGKCDDVVRELAMELGWLEELNAAWAQTRTTLDNTLPVGDIQEDLEGHVPEVGETEERLQREVDWLAESVDDKLKVTGISKKRAEKGSQRGCCEDSTFPESSGDSRHGECAKGQTLNLCM